MKLQILIDKVVVNPHLQFVGELGLEIGLGIVQTYEMHEQA